MKKISGIFIFVFVLSIQIMAQTKLKPGDKAPDFTGRDQDGKEVTLSRFKGKKVILYFYPKDNTPGCTAQACNLRDHNQELTKAGYTILGVSSDDESSHKDFIKSYSLNFPLIADTDKHIHELYRVWVEKEKEGKKYWGTARTTFVIDEKGIIEQVIENVDTAHHTQQILENKK
jgi:thioredoxin-dependent peroxiredoxin